METYFDDELSIKKIISSFKYWPRIFKLLLETDSKKFLLIIALTILDGIAPVLKIIVTQNLINSIYQSKGRTFSELLTSFIILIVVSLILDIISSIKNHFESLFRYLLVFKINLEIMSKALSLSLADFEDSKIYDKLQRAQNEASYRPYQIFTSILAVINGTVTFISSVGILCLWKWWSIFFLLIIPAISTIYFIKIGKQEFQVQWERAPKYRISWYLNFLATRDTAFKEIKLFNLGKYLLNKYKILNAQFIKEDHKLLKKRSIITFVFQLMNEFSGDIVVFLILWSAFYSEILIGNVVAYIRAVSLTQNTSQSILNSIFLIYQNNLYIKQLFQFIDMPVIEEKQLEEKEYCKLEKIYSIEFKSVSFKYPGVEEYALENVSFKVDENELVAIVGKNGSGKTTLVKLLTKLYKLDEGEILINGISIDKYSVSELRNKIGIVFQDFVHYELTVRENIGFGNLSYLNDDKKLLESASLTGMDDIINSLPDKLNTQLGKWFANGHQLSGGQWQKVAISRAFLKNADIYVLDEPSSALDPMAEREVFEKFIEITKDKMGIFISHRFSTVKLARKIIVLDNGHVVEEGTHEELLKQNKLYASLYNVQAELWKDIN